MDTWIPGVTKPFGHEERKMAMMVTALIKAREKLKIYRQHSSGEYQGGMEHAMLISLIDEALK